MMAAHLFNESGQMQEVNIPDIFDVLEGGEDENAVKFLLGFTTEEASAGGPPSQGGGEPSSMTQTTFQATVVSPNKLSPRSLSSTPTAIAADGSTILLTKEGKPRKRDPVDPSRCIFSCDKCGKAFTTKFNLKRHINLHCSPSKEAGVPVQGPPSANMPSKKAKERREALAAMGIVYNGRIGRPPGDARGGKKKKSKSKKKKLMTTTHPPSLRPPPEVLASIGGNTLPLQQTQQVTYQVQKPDTVSYHINNNNNNNSVRPSTSCTTFVQQKPIYVNQAISDVKMVTMIQQKNSQQEHPMYDVLTNQPVNLTETILVQDQKQQIVTPITYVTTSTLNHPINGVVNLQHLKPVTLPAMTTTTTVNGGLRSAPKYATIIVNGQQHQVQHHPQQQQQQLKPVSFTSGNRTITASIISSSFMSPTSSIQTSGGILSHHCPPDDLFDSEDDDEDEEEFEDEDEDGIEDDELSVATTTEMPSPISVHGSCSATSEDVDMTANDLSLKPSVVNFVVTSGNNGTEANLVSTSTNVTVAANNDDNSSSDGDSLNLPTIPQRGQLQEIPKGWLRKVIMAGKPPGVQKVLYYNTMGKKFSSQEEIDQYFARLGQTVRPGLFNFEPPKLVDEDDDDEEDDMDVGQQSNVASVPCSNSLTGLQQQPMKSLTA